MEPLPTVIKVFSLIFKVEKQRFTQMPRLDNNEMLALLIKSHNNPENYLYSGRASFRQGRGNMNELDGLRGGFGGRANFK